MVRGHLPGFYLCARRLSQSTKRNERTSSDGVATRLTAEVGSCIDGRVLIVCYHSLCWFARATGNY